MAGTLSVKQCIAKALEMKLPALAITDTNNLTGAIEFYIEALKANIKPIIGVELRTTNEQAVVLAKDYDGYITLCEMITKLCEEYPAARPVIREEEVRSQNPEFRIQEPRAKSQMPEALEDSSGQISNLSFLICSFDTSHNIIFSSTPSLLETLAQRNRKDVYIELVKAKENEWNALRSIVKEYRLPIVATNDVYFGYQKEQGLHKILRAIGTNTTIGTLPQQEIADPSQYFCTPDELAKKFTRSPDAIKNITKIVDECNVELDLNTAKFTSFKSKDDTDKYYLLRKLTEEGFARRYPKPTRVHQERLEKEYGIITKLDFVDYFLVTWDMVQYARHKNYPYVGRGSGANSIVAYCLEITNVDPIELNLFFERFLNPERKSPPDFDVDFSWKNRDNVIDYMLEKYGRENTAMICTISTFNSRGAIREVGKALGYSESEIKTVTAQLPHWGRAPLYEISKHLPEAKYLDIRAPYMQRWLKIADRVLSFPNHYGIHCGGVILAPNKMTHYTPTQVAPKGVRITQQDMFSTDDWGLVKLDVLSTRGLGVFDDTMRDVEERYGLRPPVDDYKTACNDTKTKEIMRNAETIGCFYVESPAMRQLLQKLRTDTFEMLTAASSIIRPGVSQSGMMQAFIERYHDPSKIRPPHPKIGELLRDTFGVMVYQEDVIKVAHFFAHLSLGEADLLRRGMSGKMRSKDAMNLLKDKFFSRCSAQDIEEKITAEIWRQMESFAGYSFCKAHSASYAVLSFQEAYLKAYYPAFFLCNVLNNQGGYYRPEVYIQEARRLGIEILLPNVNESEVLNMIPYVGAEFRIQSEGLLAEKSEFRSQKPVYHVSNFAIRQGGNLQPKSQIANPKSEIVNHNSIQLGFLHVKNLSERSIENILEERNHGGKYRSFEDFLSRSGVTYEDAFTLIRCGACDCFGKTRSQMTFTAKLMLRENNRPPLSPLLNKSEGPSGEGKPTKSEGRSSSAEKIFFSCSQVALNISPPRFDEELKSLSPYSPQEVCGIELETFNFTVSTQVLDYFKKDLTDTVKATDLRKHINKRVAVGGWMVASKPSRTKKGERMKFINLDDNTGMIDVVIFPKCYYACAHLIRTAGPYKVWGMVKEEYGVVNVVAEKVEVLEN